METTQAQTTLSVLEDQADAFAAEEARLIAERDGRPQITFPAELTARRGNPKVAQALAGEQNKFQTRRNTLFKQIDILSQRNGENGKQIAGLKSQQDAVEKQSQLIAQEEASVSDLYKQGLSTLPRVLALQRQAADLTGQRGQLIERISQIQLTSQENDLQIANLRNQLLSDVAKDLREVQTKKLDVLERINGAKDVFTRLALVAPVDGKVVSLAVHTKGAVIHPGDTVLEIVPAEDALEVEAHVRPDDADSVQTGMMAHVSFSAYKQRRLPQLVGTVNVVSADRLVDQRTGQPYFNVTVTVDRKALDDSPFVRLIPGLPVDVAIATGTRTPLDYFMAPVLDILQKGMRER
jgi:HlyD family type I secretion membrane fusion protein